MSSLRESDWDQTVQLNYKKIDAKTTKFFDRRVSWNARAPTKY
jgi:hypothetical protein